MNRMTALLKLTKLLVIGFTFYSIGANAEKADEYNVYQVPKPPAPEIGDWERGCANSMECLSVTDWARIGELHVERKIRTEQIQTDTFRSMHLHDGSEGLFFGSPVTYCAANTCSEGMSWEFISPRKPRLILRSVRNGRSNTQPVLVIEQHMSEDSPSRVGIGVPTYHDIKHELEVNGSILAKEIIVEADWPDYVFNNEYPLMSLGQIAEYIDVHGHLPGIPTSDEVAVQGIKIGAMQASLLEKIEEMMLHMIEQEKEIQRLRNRIDLFEKTRR